jgi:hypothetical protein
MKFRSRLLVGLLLLQMLPFSLFAESRWHKAYLWSVAALAAGQAADTASSFHNGGTETNPILGRGAFGTRQATIKFGLAGAGLVLQRFTLHRYPQTTRTWTLFNFGVAGLTSATAVHNWRTAR